MTDVDGSEVLKFDHDVTTAVNFIIILQIFRTNDVSAAFLRTFNYKKKLQKYVLRKRVRLMLIKLTPGRAFKRGLSFCPTNSATFEINLSFSMVFISLLPLPDCSNESLNSSELLSCSCRFGEDVE